MSTITAIADAVVTLLNESEVLPEGVTAERHYVPTFELKDMDTLHVSVVPRGVAIQPLGRTTFQHDVQIDIGIQQRFPPAPGSDPGNGPGSETEQVDALMGQVEQIANALRGKRLPPLPDSGLPGGAMWVRTQNEPIYLPEHLAQPRQFTSVLTLTYRVTQ